MDEINENEQPAPVVEKISKAELKHEHDEIDAEQPTMFDDLLESITKLDEEDAEKALAMIDKLIEKLDKMEENMKNKKENK